MIAEPAIDQAEWDKVTATRAQYEGLYDDAGPAAALAFMLFAEHLLRYGNTITGRLRGVDVMPS